MKWSDLLMMTLGQKVQLIIDTYNLSLREMGKICDLSSSTLSRLSHQTFDPRQSSIYHFAKATNIPLRNLIDDTITFDKSYVEARINISENDETDQIFLTSSLLDDPTILETMSLMKHLDSSQKQAILNIAQLFDRDNKEINKTENPFDKDEK